MKRLEKMSSAITLDNAPALAFCMAYMVVLLIFGLAFIPNPFKKKKR